MLWLIIATLIPIGGAFAQSDGGKRTEYVAKKPYKEYDIGYDFILSSSYNYGHLNISPDFDTFFSILRIFLIFSTVLRHPKFLFKKRLDLLVPICKE